jgi:hypothetical protein
MNKSFIACIIICLIFIISPIALANLGVYDGGETVDYSVCCLTNEASKDTGCTAENETILNPSSDNPISNTSYIKEVDDTNYPCLWRGSYDIPTGAEDGTWSIYLQLTNSNGTLAGTVLTFEVTEKWNTEQNRIFMILIIVTFILLGLGYFINEKIFPILAGFLLMVLAVYTAQYGFYGYDNDFIRNSMVILFAGLGGFLAVKNGIDMIQEGGL